MVSKLLHSQSRATVLTTWVIPLAVLVGAFSPWLILQGLYWVPFALIVAGVAYAVGLRNWKWAIYGLTVYIPFAGIPVIVLYPGASALLLIKDFLFVVPAYIGFLRGMRKHRSGSVGFQGAPRGLLLVLAGLVFVHLFNPSLANRLVGLIGFRLWLFYIPLYFLGYHLIDSKEQLYRYWKLILLAGLIPVAIGLIEGVLIYSGRAELVYSWYGSAASVVTQGFHRTEFGGEQALVRIPSTFTFVAQFSFFLIVQLSVSYGMWVRATQIGRGKITYFAVLALTVLASLLSGARIFFVLVPFFFCVAGVLLRGSQFSWKPLIGFAIAIFVLAELLGTAIPSIVGGVATLATHYLFAGQPGEFIRALNVTLVGLGPGMASQPARYGFADVSSTQINVIENLYGKTVLELGVPGLVVLLALFARILRDNYRVLVRLKDQGLRAVSASLLAFFLLIVVYGWKGNILDFDPLNVYFWLFAGIAMKLPRLEAGQHPSAETETRDLCPTGV